jgi:peroxiredoxin
MVVRALIAALGCGVLLAGGACAAPLDDAMMKMLGLDHAVHIAYLGVDGKTLTPAQFEKEMPGKSFSIEKHKNAAGQIDATLRLTVNKPGAKPKAAPIAVKVGDVLPAFALKGMDGKSVSSADWRGKPTVLSFYFGGCGPCVAEVPQLNALRAAHPELALAAVTFDSAAEAREFVATQHLNWPVLPDAGKVVEALKVTAYPLLLVLDTDGKVVGVRSGLDEKQPTVLAWVEQSLKVVN